MSRTPASTSTQEDPRGLSPLLRPRGSPSLGTATRPARRQPSLAHVAQKPLRRSSIVAPFEHPGPKCVPPPVLSAALTPQSVVEQPEAEHQTVSFYAQSHASRQSHLLQPHPLGSHQALGAPHRGYPFCSRVRLTPKPPVRRRGHALHHLAVLRAWNEVCQLLWLLVKSLVAVQWST